MFELIFGGVLCFVAFVFTFIILSSGWSGIDPVILFFLLFSSVFWAIGIVFFRKGIQKIQIDNETKKWGAILMA